MLQAEKYIMSKLIIATFIRHTERLSWMSITLRINERKDLIWLRENNSMETIQRIIANNEPRVFVDCPIHATGVCTADTSKSNQSIDKFLKANENSSRR